MRRRFPRTSAKEIAEEMMKHHPPHEPRKYEWTGGTHTGDVFYSWIQSEIRQHWGRKYPYEVFDEVCNILRQNGYWVHS